MRKGIRKIISTALIAMLIAGQCSVFAAEAPKRESAEAKYKWDLTDLYDSREAFEKDLKVLTDEFVPKLEAYKGKLNTAENIKAYLELDGEASKLLYNVYMYPNLMADLDQSNSQATEMSGMASAAYGKYLGATSFSTPEILKLDEATIKEIMEKEDMSTYKHYLGTLLKQKAHILSEKEEKILALASDITSSPREIFDKATVADYEKAEIMNAEGEKIILSSSAYSNILENGDRETRKKAYEARSESYNRIKNTLAATLIAGVKSNIFNAKARGYDSALEASLDGEHIPREIYDNLVKSVNGNLSYLHKYYEVRKKAMGVEDLYGYDAWVPLVDNYTLELPYDEANKVIKTALKPLGETYLKDYQMGIESNWIDVYEGDKKYGGGYNWGNYNTHPYILLNYDNTLNSASTLAHEMGHAMNSWYSNKEQDIMNSSYPIFTAEVASTVNELLLMDHLIKNAKTDDEKLYLLNSQIDNIKGTVYTQVMFAEFEQALYETIESGKALSAESINTMWNDTIKKYYGPHYTLGTSSEASWGRISHFYRNFYVYKYATSMSAANEIVNNIITGKEGAVENYLTFLAAGGSDYPVDTLKAAGVDMTSSSPVDNILKYFGELVDEFEQVLDKKAAAKPATTVYTIAANDMLWKIAEQYNTTVKALVELNKIENANVIAAGQEIMVPSK